MPKVSRWGNSLAVRLPAKVVEALDLHDGDEIAVTVVGKDRLEIEKDERRREAIKQIRKLAWPVPPGFRFDRLESNERK
ncbi:MAG: AbrB/MazE/SpoVT family DNA-binding domain-containing protein [Brevundimonas sp.]|uniref:AbrB/MazE/SpoVT family DNA-binding domain-containing protein n=1 Tax=Brevundimonas sp. TaxID=1871086 RepID=UPI0025BD97AF|nr:AbrB/MazE/SpoVT family DNA-binding domain-containing protein [Brevundimonas sp.]MBX3476088.1 AbrB/MazE/SpoVT family DNA-binding domain-containing protein [Brevundimonas sp.]